MGKTTRRAGYAGLAAAVLLSAGLAHAIAIGGVDAQSQYSGYTPVDAESGVFTFEDSLNGSNPSPEPGTVTTADNPALAALVGAVIDLEIQLDTSGGFDPATDSILDATFVGTGAWPEIMIWEDETRTTLLLALDVDFVNVTQILPSFPPFIPCCGSFTLGQPELSTLGVQSRLVVAGGSFAGAVGGVGTEAVLQIFISDPVPSFGTADVTNFLNDDFTVGFNVNPSSEVTWEIEFVPEPSVALLLGAGLVALGAMRGRTSPR